VFDPANTLVVLRKGSFLPPPLNPLPSSGGRGRRSGKTYYQIQLDFSSRPENHVFTRYVGESLDK